MWMAHTCKTQDTSLEIHLDTFSYLGLFYDQRSQSKPKQTTSCLGFIISFTNMTLPLTDEKKTKTKELSEQILSCNRVNVTNLAKLNENVVAIFPDITL